MVQGQIVWFEIPVRDLDRAMSFYSGVLSVKIEKHKFLEQEYGILSKDKHKTGGALMVKQEINPGITLFFYVIDLSESIKNAVQYGGKIITPKTLIKQKNKEGHITINSNMIDGNVGYYSEILDCEGNQISLYSNS